MTVCSDPIGPGRRFFSVYQRAESFREKPIQSLKFEPLHHLLFPCCFRSQGGEPPRKGKEGQVPAVDLYWEGVHNCMHTKRHRGEASVGHRVLGCPLCSRPSMLSVDQAQLGQPDTECGFDPRRTSPLVIRPT